MNELLRKRVDRRLEGLSDEMGYRVLDYVEFLESKYGDKPIESSAFQKIAETVEDAMRAGRIPVAAIKGTMKVVDAAGKVMQGISAAGRAVVAEIERAGTEGPEVKEEVEADATDDEQPDIEQKSGGS